MEDTHMGTRKNENYKAEETLSWDEWIKKVEWLHSGGVDGDLEEDGYSLDTFHEMWKRGWEWKDAVYASKKNHRDMLQ